MSGSLDPSGDEGRSLLRRELLRPEYNDQDLLQRVVRFVERQVDRGLDAASTAPTLSTLAAMLVLLALVAALGLLLSRARRTTRAAREPGAVLGEEVVSAAELRARAVAALEAGRPEDAVVDGFRALTVRQVERGRLLDAPGATAHEVAALLGHQLPPLAGRLDGAARLFDSVLYGDRHPTRAQAESVLALDDDLVAVR